MNSLNRLMLIAALTGVSSVGASKPKERKSLDYNDVEKIKKAMDKRDRKKEKRASLLNK